jgi:[ribosomal protein S5]-alanine N-acetyltransferase
LGFGSGRSFSIIFCTLFVDFFFQLGSGSGLKIFKSPNIAKPFSLAVIVPKLTTELKLTKFIDKHKEMENKKLDIKLRPTEFEDLGTLFLFQTDTEGGYLAAFMSKYPTEKTAYIDKWTKLLSNPTVNSQTIIIDKTIVGSIAKFVMEGDTEITYWIDRKFWRQGIATKALNELLTVETIRPIFGRVAFDNFASQKVLEKNGFVKVGTDKAFANARQEEIEEYIYKLTE